MQGLIHKNEILTLVLIIINLVYCSKYMIKCEDISYQYKTYSNFFDSFLICFSMQRFKIHTHAISFNRLGKISIDPFNEKNKN